MAVTIIGATDTCS
jgi:hypothetical protein